MTDNKGRLRRKKMRRTKMEIKSDQTNISYYYLNDNFNKPIVEIDGLNYDVQCDSKKSAINLMSAYSYKEACKIVNRENENKYLNRLSNKNYSKVTK